MTQVHVPLDIQPTQTFFPNTLHSLSKIPSLIYEEYIKEFNKYTKAIHYHTIINEDEPTTTTPKKNDQMMNDCNNR